MKKQPLILVAASGLAREVLAAVDAGGTQIVVGILDDNVELHGTRISDVAVSGPIRKSLLDRADVKFVVCVGSGSTRQRIVDDMRILGIGADRFASVVHPTASISANSDVGVGSVILAQVVMTSDVTVGSHVVVMPHAVFTHDDTVEDFATVGAGVVLGGTVRVGRRSYLGMGVSVRENTQIGDDAVLGMGATVLEDVPAGQTWIGLPARQLGSDRLGRPDPQQAVKRSPRW